VAQSQLGKWLSGGQLIVIVRAVGDTKVTG